MKRKVGEIFELHNEWYQCIEGRCKDCYFSEKRFICKQLITQNFCTSGIIFKKLEKVGEPYYSKYYGKFYQKYITYIPAVGYNFKIRIEPVEPASGTEIYVELKQKEDTEENKLNLKPFNLEAAKAGKPVCTRDGRKARIICFDAKFPETGNIVTLVEKEGVETTLYHYDDGHCSIGRGYDLMMLPEKKEGWVNVYKDSVYDTKEEALAGRSECRGYIDTIKVSWEE